MTVRHVSAARVTEMQGFSTVEWIFLANDGAKVGDAISADAGGMPIYKVVAIEEGRAWLRAEDQSPVQVMPLDRFRWKVSA
jgi:hypothetical protein